MNGITLTFLIRQFKRITKSPRWDSRWAKGDAFNESVNLTVSKSMYSYLQET